MHVVCTQMDAGGTGWVTVRSTRGLGDVFAYLAQEHGCRHGVDGQGFCLVNPPRWTWWVGVPNRQLSLGGAIWAFGQWAFWRADAIPEVWRHTVTGDDLVERFGWDALMFG